MGERQRLSEQELQDLRELDPPIFAWGLRQAWPPEKRASLALVLLQGVMADKQQPLLNASLKSQPDGTGETTLNALIAVGRHAPLLEALTRKFVNRVAGMPGAQVEVTDQVVNFKGEPQAAPRSEGGQQG